MIIFEVTAKVNCRKCGTRKTFNDSYAAEDFEDFVANEFEDNSVDHLKKHGWTRNFDGAWFCPAHSETTMQTVRTLNLPKFQFTGTQSNQISESLLRRIQGAGCFCGRQKTEGLPFCKFCFCILPGDLREVLRQSKGTKLEAAYDFIVENLSSWRRK